MDAAPKSALGDATNAPPPPAAKPPRPAADKPRRVVTWYHPDQLPPPPTAELLRPAPPAAPPKESSSAFVFFGRATRDDIKAAHPDWSLGAVGRELSKRWRALDDAAKKTFHDLAAADKERYDREKAAYDAANLPAPVVAERAPLNEAPPPRTARREFSPAAADVADADAALKRMEAELAATLAATPAEASALLAYASRREAARLARGGQRPATMLRPVATDRPSLGDPAPGPARPLLLAPPDPVEKRPRKTRKTRKGDASRADHDNGLDSLGRLNPSLKPKSDHGNGLDSLGRRNAKISNAALYIECLEGTPNNPGPAVPGAEELVAEAVPEKCLGYPDYKYDRGNGFFKKSGTKAAQLFYKANGYYKIAVKGSKSVFKFFKEVKRA